MTEGLDLHLGVDKGAGFVGRALETALREAIRSGRLHPGARLPGSRSLAADLGISRGTVVQAYAQLIAEGWLTGTTGSGTRVADLPGPAPGPAAGAGDDPAPAAARLAVDLRPGRPDLSSFPRTDWASSVRRALAAAPYEDLDYAGPAGLPTLRAARRRVLAGTRRGPARRADHRVRHSPAARLVRGAGGAGRSGTGNLRLSGLRYWTARSLAWWA
ncbi:MAG TPA: GntR family transcriptional regulator [Trebonia sp.]|nr:GntR family transcriptional regulator [Trebonia sp.]